MNGSAIKKELDWVEEILGPNLSPHEITRKECMELFTKIAESDRIISLNINKTLEIIGGKLNVLFNKTI